jgi:diguanylate cyclase (GGDEF)-like protein
MSAQLSNTNANNFAATAPNALQAIQLAHQNHSPVSPPFYQFWYEVARDPLSEAGIYYTIKKQAQESIDQSEIWDIYLRMTRDVSLFNAVIENALELETAVSDSKMALLEIKECTTNVSNDIIKFNENINDQEYINKNFDEIIKNIKYYKSDIEIMSFRIDKIIKFITVISEHAKISMNIAFIDKLTGLATRTLFEKKVEKIIMNVDQIGKPTSILMIDVDNFKAINDTYGHRAGDEYLSRLGACIRAAVRGGDVSARYGGEEFIIALPDTPIQGASVVAENIRSHVENSCYFISQAGEMIKSTVSIGVATGVVPFQLDRIIDEADKRLYAAKKLGKNCFINVS